MNRQHLNHRRSRRGFTLVELLIAVSLTAGLAVATAAGLAAATKSAEAGDGYLRASRTSSRVLDTIVADVHAASAVQVLSPTSLRLYRSDGVLARYYYDAAADTLRLEVDDGVTVHDNVLARQISSLSFSGLPEQDPATLVTRIVQVTVNMEVADANTPSTAMTASANCRRKRSYR